MKGENQKKQKTSGIWKEFWRQRSLQIFVLAGACLGCLPVRRSDSSILKSFLPIIMLILALGNLLGGGLS